MLDTTEIGLPDFLKNRFYRLWDSLYTASSSDTCLLDTLIHTGSDSSLR